MPGQWTYGQAPLTFFIEGIENSSTLGDITVTVTYTYTDLNGQHVLQASQLCTVTPVVTAFTVTPAGGATGTNITLFNGNDGSRGLRAQPGSGVAGVAFSASLRMDNLIGVATPKYVQNMLNVDNGDNGTKDGTGTACGWLMQDNTGRLHVLTNGTFGSNGIVDADKGATDPTTSVADFNSVTNATTVTITADDSPTTGWPANNGQGTAVDLTYKFKLFILVQWTENNSPVYYFLGHEGWVANFYGTAAGGVPPIDTVEIPHGVTSDGQWVYDHANAVTDTSTTWNGNSQWIQS